MAESFTLPLRPIPEKRDRPDTLPVEIAQINNQWGSFREVNEDVLRNKIAEEEEKDGMGEVEESDQDATDLDSTERLEQLYKRRAEITQFAMQAHMETMFALDFVSLLLSKQAPRQAETSMSAFLKQVAPLGSLNAEVVHPPAKPDSTTKDVSAVSRGWRIQNFNAAANKLLQAASRLETEVASETRYWNEVLAVKDKDGKQSLGVQYGFLEATPVFRDRGLASLRRAEDGALSLDEGLIPPKARFVRVRVIQDGQLSGSSKPMRSSFNGDGTIEDRILQARDTVYEDELFHELVREARAIASFGVTTRQNLIQIPASDNLEILLDLVDTDEDTSEPEHGISQQGTSIAEGLAHTIRILLAYAHRQNLRRRTQLPLPLTPKTRPVPEHQLIRPALAYIKHMSQVRWLQSLLENLFGVLQSAAVENLVGQFLTPFVSMFNGKILTPRGSFSIAIHTNLSSPPFGTTFEVSFNMPKYPDLESPGKISHREEVEAAITHLLLLDVVFTISSNSSLKPECDKDPAKRTWEAIYPQHGELLIPTPKPNSEKRKKMKIVLSRHELSLEIYTVRCIDGTGRGNWEMPSYHAMPHTWKPSPTAGPPKPPSLMDFVSKVSRS
ncbi:hypothetical protein N7519_002996 [Penicillium mononematosum]|uniref:uncharacterized protein n=1 Tax=Penicillium mononematosum TaxID=268346 RepID=UPI002548B20E|nr:uncharacterized protein N7519_002996 [Penicillium mononematosum]KAJ6188088.1 hypothetical protein N7519_002996 [Penicillium mononematosum]